MSKHISYTDRRAEPVYIGFDEPENKPKKPTNGFGSAATFFGVLGLLSTGIAVSTILTFLRSHDIIEPPPFGVRILIPFAGILVSGLALLCAFIGMFKKPRGYAILGGFLALIPIAGFVGLDRHLDRLMDQHEYERALRFQRNQTDLKIGEAIKNVLSYQKEKGRLPDGLDGNKLVIRLKDSWDNELRYEPSDHGFCVRSAGPDGKFETPDDCLRTQMVKSVYTSTER